MEEWAHFCAVPLDKIALLALFGTLIWILDVEFSLLLQARSLSPHFHVLVVQNKALNSLRCKFTRLDYVCGQEAESRLEVGLEDGTSSPPPVTHFLEPGPTS